MRCMIDQDITEISSLKENGIQPILCMFHLMRQIMLRIKKLDINLQSSAFTYIKIIQRSGQGIFESTKQSIKKFKRWWYDFLLYI